MRHFRTSILSVCRASRDTRPWPPQYDHRRLALLHLALLDTTPRCIPSVPSSVLTGPHDPIIFSLPLRLRLRFKNTALGRQGRSRMRNAWYHTQDSQGTQIAASTSASWLPLALVLSGVVKCLLYLEPPRMPGRAVFERQNRLQCACT